MLVQFEQDGGALVLMQSLRRKLLRSISGLLTLKMPRAIPAFAGRILRQLFDALDERHRRSIAGHGQERGFKGATRLLPAMRPISGQSFGETSAQFDLRRRQLAL